MAQVEVKGEVAGLVYDNKGVQILESFKTKNGEIKTARYTAWLDSPTNSIQVGQKVTARGLLAASIGSYKSKEGEEKTVVNLSINFATITVDSSKEQDELPF